ncbi:MAG: hypothetical protein OXC37_02340 [Bdellovibrionaceae bacterium]|nr:hypothetical protein [Pseudobdellovibrionaceae bacterium]
MDLIKIKEIAKTASEQNNCRVYDIFKHRDRLQVFIDKKNQTVNLKDCENVFHSLRFLLHSELPYLLEKNRLEVSSPGIEKQLREKWHFKESIGQSINLTTNYPVKFKNENKTFQTRSFIADLISVSEDTLHLKKSQLKFSIPFSEVKTAKLIFNQKKLTKKRGK